MWSASGSSFTRASYLDHEVPAAYWGFYEAMGFGFFTSDCLGALIGEVMLVKCVCEHDSEWFVGPFGYVFADAERYATPIPYAGVRGLFEITTDSYLKST